MPAYCFTKHLGMIWLKKHFETVTACTGRRLVAMDHLLPFIILHHGHQILGRNQANHYNLPANCCSKLALYLSGNSGNLETNIFRINWQIGFTTVQNTLPCICSFFLWPTLMILCQHSILVIILVILLVVYILHTQSCPPQLRVNTVLEPLVRLTWFLICS